LKPAGFKKVGTAIAVFIHRSIKTRIETGGACTLYWTAGRFLYIDPLKQGLKHIILVIRESFLLKFLYIDPLKQGLKLLQ